MNKDMKKMDKKNNNKKVKLSHKIKAFNKVNSNVLTMSLLYAFFTILCAVMLINTVTAESKKMLNSASPIGFDLKLAFDTAHVTYYEDFTSEFPINKASFNESVDHFCAQKGTQYANGNRPSLAASQFNMYHIAESNLASKIVKGVATKEGHIGPDGQLIIDDPDNPPYSGMAEDSIILVNQDLRVVLNDDYDPTTLHGFYDKVSEDGTMTFHTNWMYRPVKFWFHSSYFNEDQSIVDSEFEVEEGKSDIGVNGHGYSDPNDGYTDLGFAFIIATMKEQPDPAYYDQWKSPHEYSKDPIQLTIWRWLKFDVEESGYLGANKAFHTYSEESKDPNVKVYPDENVGTTIDDSNTTYYVGPFEMSKYIRAASYTYSTEDAYYTETIPAPTSVEGEETISYTLQVVGETGKTIQDDFSNIDEEMKGDIIGFAVILTNEEGDEKELEVSTAVLEDGTTVKLPDDAGELREKKFSIALSASDTEGYDEVKDIKILYQRIGVRMDGKWYEGFQGEISIDFTDDDVGCDRYDPEPSQCSGTYRDFQDRYNAPYRYREDYAEGEAGGTHGISTGEYIHYHCSGHDTPFCGKQEHVHGDGHCNTANCTHKHNDPAGSCCDKNHDHSKGGCNTNACSHIHTKHTSECYDGNHLHCPYGGTGKHYDPSGCCSKEEHIHDDECYFHKAINPGCSAQEECTGGDYYYTCQHHGHEWCRSSEYELSSDMGELDQAADLAQDAITLNADLIPEQMYYTFQVNVPMKTKMAITKGIVKTEHVGEAIVVYENGTERLLNFDNLKNGNLEKPNLGMTMDEKREDSKKVERGDYVTYKVVVRNDSRFATTVKVKDVIFKDKPKETEYLLPEALSGEYIIYYVEGDVAEQLSAETEITVPEHDQLEFIAKVRPREEQGAYTNQVEFTTTNHGDEHMHYVEWGDPSVTWKDESGTSHDGSESTFWMSADQKPNVRGNIVNLYAQDIIGTYKDLEKDSDTYEVKEYHVDVEKYIYDIEHKNQDAVANAGRGLDTTFDASENRNYVRNHEKADITKANLDAHETVKEGTPVYAEYGDVITYKIDVYNTTDKFVTRTDAPYWEPDKAYVTVEDILPDNYSDLQWAVETSDGVELTTDDIEVVEEDGKIRFINVMVPPNGISTITVQLTNENKQRDVVHTNTASVIDDPESGVRIRNINKGPGKTNNDVPDFLDAILNYGEPGHEPLLESSDHFIVNEYYATITKYIEDYIPVMNEYNEAQGFTKGESNDELRATIQTHIRNTYSESDKYDHPVMVEKGEFVKYNMRFTNKDYDEALDTNRDSFKDLAKPGIPATQVRPTKITDYLQDGLEYVDGSVTAVLYSIGESDGAESLTKIQDITTDHFSITKVGDKIHHPDPEVDQTILFNKYEIALDDSVIVNPGECIIYEIVAKVEASNMYLYRLENRVEITTLTNINCDDPSEGEHNRIVSGGDDDSVPVETTEQDNQNVAGKTVTHQDITTPVTYPGLDESVDYVRLKDLIIAGKVWVEDLKDGYYASGEQLKPEVIVKLYYVDDSNNKHLYRTTKTDSNGQYTFAVDVNGNPYEGEYQIEKGTGTASEITGSIISYESRQRVPKTMPNTENGVVKARNEKDTELKDANGKLNYTSGPYAKYYVEFEYDGLYYKSVELYSNDTNLSENGDPETWTPISVNISEDTGEASVIGPSDLKYINDSNAFEFWDDRQEFNTRYETIGYDIAYKDEGSRHGNKNDDYYTSLEYEKGPGEGEDSSTAHVSELLEEDDLEGNPHRKITARSFVKSTDEARTEHLGIMLPGNDDAKNYEGDFGNTKLLFLFDIPEGDNTLPETEYLKYINLGLEKREKVDVSLVKDVYQVKTTINGEEIIYEFDQSSPKTLEEIIGEIYQKYLRYVGDGESKSYEPYTLDLYNTDYNYRVNDYDQMAVRDYKTILSELNIEVTYKITVINNENKEDESSLANNDIPMEVVIDEISEYYDKAFMEYTDEAQAADASTEPAFDNTKFVDGTLRTNTLGSDGQYTILKDKSGNTVTTFAQARSLADNGDGTGWNGKGANYITMMKKYGDFLQPQRVKIAEAWMMDGTGDSAERVNLELYNESLYNDKRMVEYTDSEGNKGGYNTLYIRGQNGKGISDKSGNEIKLAEGEKLEVFVKYLIDKDQLDNRTLKIEDKVEKHTDASKLIYDYGMEGMAEITAFTTYYGAYNDSRQSLDGEVKYSDFYDQNGQEPYKSIVEHYKHLEGQLAGTVDDDSNPSNIGEGPGISSLDRKPNGTVYLYTEDPGEAAIWFEDDTFKTGIKFNVNPDRVRSITGKVWDDSRSTYVDDQSVVTPGETSSDAKKQYGGDGVYRDPGETEDTMKEGYTIDINTNVTKLEDAKSNENLRYLADKTTSEDMKAKLKNADYNKYDPTKTSEEDEYEKQDFLVDGVGVQLVEIVKLPIYDPDYIDANGNPKLFKLNDKGEVDVTQPIVTDEFGNPVNDEVGYPKFSEVRYYETSVKNKENSTDEGTPIKTKSGADEEVGYGNYKLSGFKPGYYIVKFAYGNSEEDGTVTPEMQTFNGQDYKSTAYMPTVTLDGETQKGELESITVATGAKYNPKKELVEYPPEAIMIIDYLIDEDGNPITGQYVYKSDSPEGVEESTTFYAKYDDILNGLEYQNRNDARDDEIQRLDSISYSEVMTNAKAEILKGISSKTQYATKYDEKIASDILNGVVDPADTKEPTIAKTVLETTNAETGKDEISWQVQSKDNMDRILAGETAMNAETITFYVKPEKVKAQEEYSGRQRLTSPDMGEDDFIHYNIKGVDFGLTYRPEAQLTVDKEIEKITITTSDREEIMTVAFKDYVNAQGNTELEDNEKEYFDLSKQGGGYESIALSSKNGRIKRVVDTDNSKGLNNLQYIFNQDWMDMQGFFYINIDDEILQGCTIGIDYSLRVENISEIDRISRNLDILRYKGNVAGSSLVSYLDEYKDELSYVQTVLDAFNTINFTEYDLTDIMNIAKNYSGSKTAEALLHKIWFDKDENYASDGEYRIIEKTMTKDQNNKYYGSFLGGAYYTNKVLKELDDEGNVKTYNDPSTGTNKEIVIDTIVDIKVDKILDYIDNDLVFVQDHNNTDNHRWTAVNSDALMSGDGKNGRLLANKLFSTGEQRIEDDVDEYEFVFPADDASTDADIIVKKKDSDGVYKEIVFDKNGEIKFKYQITNPDDIDKDRKVYTLLDTYDVSYESGLTSNLVISVDDRIVDDYTTYGYTSYEVDPTSTNLIYQLQQILRRALRHPIDLVGRFNKPTDEETDNPNTAMANASLSRYLEPRMDVTLSAEIVPVHDSTTQKTNKYNLNNGTLNQYAGKIILSTERVVSSETDTENLAFENIAEILQFSITNGRRTNFKTTLGNAEVSRKEGVYEESLTGHKPDPEKPEDPKEEDPNAPKDPDTSAVEVITLSPPTGLDRLNRIIRNVVAKTQDTIIPTLIIVIVIMVFVGGGFAYIRKKKKKK